VRTFLLVLSSSARHPALVSRPCKIVLWAQGDLFFADNHQFRTSDSMNSTIQKTENDRRPLFFDGVLVRFIIESKRTIVRFFEDVC
jgi:hypothetical protein